mmetsp:Transcript_1246/g.2754  ORF Transcript_1246/g.2754 Transcript_1246/m.2754 type:complete len:311 (-) Transcript_1246:2066-2998(-)
MLAVENRVAEQASLHAALLTLESLVFLHLPENGPLAAPVARDFPVHAENALVGFLVLHFQVHPALPALPRPVFAVPHVVGQLLKHDRRRTQGTRHPPLDAVFRQMLIKVTGQEFDAAAAGTNHLAHTALAALVGLEQRILETLLAALHTLHEPETGLEVVGQSVVPDWEGRLQFSSRQHQPQHLAPEPIRRRPAAVQVVQEFVVSQIQPHYVLVAGSHVLPRFDYPLQQLLVGVFTAVVARPRNYVLCHARVEKNDIHRDGVAETAEDRQLGVTETRALRGRRTRAEIRDFMLLQRLQHALLVLLAVFLR